MNPETIKLVNYRLARADEELEESNIFGKVITYKDMVPDT